MLEYESGICEGYSALILRQNHALFEVTIVLHANALCFEFLFHDVRASGGAEYYAYTFTKNRIDERCHFVSICQCHISGFMKCLATRQILDKQSNARDIMIAHFQLRCVSGNLNISVTIKSHLQIWSHRRRHNSQSFVKNNVDM